VGQLNGGDIVQVRLEKVGTLKNYVR